MKPALVIWVDGLRAAELYTGKEGMTLRYTDAWQNNPRGYPFSPHLPLQRESGGAEVRHFFENLLPEGTALDVAASMHKLSRHDAFGLLAKIGREAAGALCLLSADEEFHAEPTLRPLSLDELSDRIRQRPHIPFNIWDRQFRLSIAGYQDKLAIHLDDQDRMYLPDDGASSTHILKPENANRDFAHMPANEYFCMRLARSLNVSVPDVTLLHIPEAVFRVARYDRQRQKNRVARLHQIDLCQVLNLSVEMKYQHAYEFSPPGATCVDLFKAAEMTVAPAQSRLQLVNWILFNYLIGNTDAHAKNVSFFLDAAGLRVAPFYDLVCGTIYGLKNLALFIGVEEEINLVGSNDWAAFCDACGISRALLAGQMRAQAEGWRKHCTSLLEDTDLAQGERAFLQGLAADIDARAALMLEHAVALRKQPI